MNKKETYIFVGLFLVLFAGFGLLAAIIFQQNIPISITIGAAIGILVGTIADMLKHSNQQSK